MVGRYICTKAFSFTYFLHHTSHPTSYSNRSTSKFIIFVKINTIDGHLHLLMAVLYLPVSVWCCLGDPNRQMLGEAPPLTPIDWMAVSVRLTVHSPSCTLSFGVLITCHTILFPTLWPPCHWSCSSCHHCLTHPAWQQPSWHGLNLSPLFNSDDGIKPPWRMEAHTSGKAYGMFPEHAIMACGRYARWHIPLPCVGSTCGSVAPSPLAITSSIDVNYSWAVPNR